MKTSRPLELACLPRRLERPTARLGGLLFAEAVVDEQGRGS